MAAIPLTTTVEDARDFVVARFGGRASSVEYVGEGMWSRCFGFVLDGEEFVIRFGRHVDDFRRDRFAMRWSTGEAPIPAVTDIDAHGDGWYAISTRAHGTPLEQLDACGWQATLPSILTTFDALRTADLGRTTGFGGWNADGIAPATSWRSFLARVGDDPTSHRTHGWRQRLEASPIGSASFERGMQQMLDLADATPDTVRCLVHNDLLNRNALAAGGRVCALFDWGCSLFGDFVYELATFVFWSTWYPVIDASDIRNAALAHYERIGLDVPNFDERLRCCAIHIGLEHIGYTALLGDFETQRRIDDRMAGFDGRHR